MIIIIIIIMRLLLIRHAESASNVFQKGAVASLGRDATQEDFFKKMRAESSSDDGDVTLTDLGFEQAEKLAGMWHACGLTVVK